MASRRHRDLGQPVLVPQGRRRLSSRRRSHPLARLDQGADMTITARMLTQDTDGIGGYMAHPDGAGRRPRVLMAHPAHGVTAGYKIDAYPLAPLGFNVPPPSLFNTFGRLGTNHLGPGAEPPAQPS